jgi:hypothetical protein
MPGGVSEHVQRLTVVVAAVVEEDGPEFFGALPLASQFPDVGHAEVVMHLLRHIVRRPGRSREGRNPLEGEHAMSRWVEQDQPVRVIVGAVGGDLIARAVPQPEELPVELREPAAVGGIKSGVHQHWVAGHLGPPARVRRFRARRDWGRRHRSHSGTYRTARASPGRQSSPAQETYTAFGSKSASICPVLRPQNQYKFA